MVGFIFVVVNPFLSFIFFGFLLFFSLFNKATGRIENDQILESVIDLNKTQVQSQKNIKSGNPFLSFSSSWFYLK